MSYQIKYLKYKAKYLALQNQISAVTNSEQVASIFAEELKRHNKPITQYGELGDKTYIIGINFEGGKIIKHILKNKYCKGYVNCQIAMDAPYQTPPRVADETLRTKGRSELQFHGYDEEKLKSKLSIIFKHIIDKYNNTKLVIQIARGRAWKSTFDEVIKPVLDKLNITEDKYKIIHGYRSTDYYNHTDNSDFIFFNYGMFAELTDNIKIEVGEICNPVISYDIFRYCLDTGFTFYEKKNFEYDDKNILNNFQDIKKLKLFGIADEMKFITPSVYDKKHIIKLVKSI